MPRSRYLIVGGGMTAAAAVEGIREVDPNGPIVVVGAEQDPPYNRPPLTKGLWKGDSLDDVWRHSDRLGVTLQLGTSITSLDLSRKQATDDHGVVYEFEKCLLATGGTPTRLPIADSAVMYFRTLADYRRLRALTDQKQRFLVIGGGFIGSEIAAALAMNGKSVTLLLRGSTIGERAYPADLAQFLNDYFEQKGVQILRHATLVAVQTRGDSVVVKIRAEEPAAKRELQFDGVIAGLGIKPNVDLARAAGLTVTDGIEVDEHLQTSHPDVYAAGDVASFYNPALGRRLRVEHEDNANTMGKQAGQTMAGRVQTYDHLPSFYSDLFDLGYEAVGQLDAGSRIVSDWKEPYREGVVYYLQDTRVRGVLLWNVWDQLEAARHLIAEPGPIPPDSLFGRIPT